MLNCICERYQGDMQIAVLDENSGGFAVHPLRDGDAKSILVLVKFKIRGNLRFLSHAEVLRVFQRACVRAGIKMQYSQGFNPRPRLSLPLPRSVGVETDDDLLCFRIDQNTSEQANKSIGDLCTSMKTKLSEQVPEDFELVSVEVTKAKCAPQPRTATYVLAVRQEYVNEKLKARIERVLASESLSVQRSIYRKDSRHKTQDTRLKTQDTRLKTQDTRPKTQDSRQKTDDRKQTTEDRRQTTEDRRQKTVDVRGFMESIELDERGIVVECKISSAGTIRIEEILELLELDVEKLAAPIRRTSVQWQQT